MMIQNFNSLRFIFALLIFFHHSCHNFIQGGPVGVSFFFILSGFVLMAGYSDRCTSSNFSYIHYFKKRILRIYPIHLLCLFAYCILCYKNLSLNLIPNFFLVQSWIPIKSFYFSGNPLSWCLCDFLFFYLMFPPLNSMLKHYRQTFILVFFSIILAYIACIVCLKINEENAHAFFYINPLLRSFDFIIGMILYSMYNFIHTKNKYYSYFTKSLIEISAIAILVLFMSFANYGIESKYYFASYYWIPISLMLFVFSVHDTCGGGESQICYTINTY